MGKHNESVNRSGTCLTPGCGKSRDAGTWYCKDCNREFRAEQDKRRGTVGNYPESWTTFVNGKPVDYDTKITIKDGKPLDEPILMKNGRVVGGQGGTTINQSTTGGWWDEPRGVDWGPQVKGKVDARPACDNGGKGHDGRTPFYTLPGGKILYGARGSNLTHANLEHLDLIIDCAGVYVGAGPCGDPVVAAAPRIAAGPHLCLLHGRAWPDRDRTGGAAGRVGDGRGDRDPDGQGVALPARDRDRGAGGVHQGAGEGVGEGDTGDDGGA